MSYTRGRHQRVKLGQQRAEPGVGARVLRGRRGGRRSIRPVAVATDRHRLHAGPRPCGIPIMFSERVSLQRTGRPDPLREPRHERVLRVGTDLRAEAAADVGRDHPQPPGVDAQPARDLVARGLGVLRRAPQRQPPVVAPLRRGGARLQRGGGEPLVDDLGGDDRRRTRRRGARRRASPGRTRPRCWCPRRRRAARSSRAAARRSTTAGSGS